MKKRKNFLLPALLFAAPFVIFGQGVHNEYAKNIHYIDSVINDAVTSNNFAGQLLIAKDNQVLLYKGYGFADRKNKIPVDRKTVFDVGSLTKQFTAAAILKLEEDRKLNVTDSIAKYFQNVPADKRVITIHQLLTHTAGLPDEIGDDYDTISKDAFIVKLFSTPLLYKPGSSYKYSNADYSMLGIIIESISGLSYEKYLRQKLLKPAGLTMTGYVLPLFNKKEVAVGYYNDGRSWGKPNEMLWDQNGPYWNLKSNGGILTNVGELFQWYESLQHKKILGEKTLMQFFTPYVPENRGSTNYYCYGWVKSKTSTGETKISHNGSNGIFSSDFRIYPESGWIVIAATNVQNSPVTNTIFETILRKTAEPQL